MNALAILNYHGFEARTGEYAWLGEEIPYVVPRDRFAAQIQELKGRGFSSLDLDSLRQWALDESKPGRSVMITFDDALKSQAVYAAPVLKAAGFTGVFFVPALLVGQEGFMSWEDLRGLVQQGFEIGSHGLRHVPLTQLNAAEVYEEFEVSKKMLEDKLSVRIRSFSIPRGYYSPSMREMAQRAGYEFLFTSSFDLNARPADLFFLKRMVVKKITSDEKFRRLVEGRLGAVRYWEKAKESVRGALPSGVYDAMAAVKRFLRRS